MVNTLELLLLLHSLTDQGSWPSPINRSWLNARQVLRTRLYWEVRTNNSFPCLLSLGVGQTCSLYGMRVGVCPEVRLEGWLRWCYMQEACTVPCFCSQHPVFAPGSSKVEVGLFWSLYLLGAEFAPTAHAWFFIPVSPCCVAQGEVYPGITTAAL